MQKQTCIICKEKKILSDLEQHMVKVEGTWYIHNAFICDPCRERLESEGKDTNIEVANAYNLSYKR